MKRLLKFTVCILAVALLINLSCKKEHSCEGCINGNHPPTAIAGPDQVITLPTDSILLDGSASNDPDGTISEWLWTKISGPASFNLVNPSSSKTVVKNLVAGIYQFELKVTDDKGLPGKDAMQIIVDAVPTNHPPIANAGSDSTIFLPANTINLDGSGSTDPDNNITSYAWTKIFGPSSFYSANLNAAQTQVTDLSEGIYQFELKVTDAGGLFSNDTIKINVNASSPPPVLCEPMNRPIVTAQLIPVGNLSQARGAITSVSAGNKLFFAGGSTGDAAFSSRVDIYDIATQNWSIATLSVPRVGLTAITSGNIIFFAGGYNNSGISSRIDIYDLTTQDWSTIDLPHTLSAIVSAKVGNKILFAGEFLHQLIVYAFDISTNRWSTMNLGPMRYGLAINTAGNKVYLAGGCERSNDNYPSSIRIDIYDDATGSWTVSVLNTRRAFMQSIFKNGKIYWAGGVAIYDWSYENGDSIMCQVEIKDLNTQTSTITNLSRPVYWDWTFSQNSWAFENDDKIGFFGGTYLYNYQWSWSLDIYNITTNSWSVGVLNPSLAYIPGSLVSLNNTIYIAGGYKSYGIYTTQVWKLEF